MGNRLTHFDRTLNLLSAARAFDRHRHIPLFCQGVRVGWLRKDHAARLQAWPDVFAPNDEGLQIAPSPDCTDNRTAALARVVETLHREGMITGWRDERYAVVTDFHSPPLLHVERAAARFFGFTTYATHANAYVCNGMDFSMWLARRAASKPIDPGMLDNLVGGGMSAGTDPRDALAREAWEEAGVPPALTGQAVAAGTVQVLREVKEGVQSEIIYVHDLEVPAEFQPRNIDGEVAEFMLIQSSGLVTLLETRNDIALEAGLVMLSFLLRQKIIRPNGTKTDAVLNLEN